jgi:cell division protein ZapA (FtsZ GTPase activity inhibitor)
MEKRQFKIEMLGTSFTVQSAADPAYLADITAYVQGKIDEVKNRYNFADPLKASLLAALNIADDLFREREGREPGLRGEIASAAQRLIESIDDELLKHTPYDPRSASDDADKR